MAMSDEGFHEIQLNGKQLVFLFMATTVVSVVIFLCGVLVGRGVRAEKGPDPAALMETGNANAGPSAPSSGSVAPATAAAGAPAGAADNLTYPSRLDNDKQQPDDLKAPLVDPPVVAEPEPAKAAAPARPAPSAATSVAAASANPAPASPAAAPEASAAAFTVQVAAMRERSEAEAVLSRLSKKGYDAYLVEPATGAPSAVFRVRVGKFNNRREAEQIVRRLEKEEQFRPWITR